MIGTILGERYRIIRRLGAGAMGQVWLAEHLALQRLAAVKVLLPSVAQKPAHISRFRREARAANQVQHPNIVGIYDFGQLPDGRLFLSMEYVEGSTLRDLLEQFGRLQVPRVLDLMKQLATAIDHAHSCNVIHRDIKPENLYVVETAPGKDLLKVLDFGLAKIVGDDVAMSLTTQGQIFGSPAYVSPEHLRSNSSDSRNDIYSAGIVFYEMLVGRPPFTGTLMEILQAHTHTQVIPPSERYPHENIGPALDRLVLRCLEKEPERRFQSGAELVAAIEALPMTRSTATLFDAGDSADDDLDANTDTRWGVSGVSEIGLAMADNEFTSQVSLLASWRRQLKDLGQHLLHAQLDSPVASRLSIEIAKVVGLDDEVARNAAARESLLVREERLEQTAREREASLRFAIGDLSFDRANASPDTLPDLDDQILQLSNRLSEMAAEMEQQRDAFRGQGIELAAVAAELDERRSESYARLELVVDALLPMVESDLELASVIDQYDSIRSSLGRPRE